MDFQVFEDVLLEITEVLSSQTALAYELAILSKVCYKNSNAQRKQKHFGALKKIERNFRKFVSNEVLNAAQNELCVLEDSPSRLNRSVKEIHFVLYQSYLYLNEVCKNCMESAQHSLIQLRIERFVKYHVLLVTLSSKIYSLTGKLMAKMKTWILKLQSTFDHLKVLKLPDDSTIPITVDALPACLNEDETTISINETTDIADKTDEEISLTCIEDENAIDVGVVIDRSTFLKNTQQIQSTADSSPKVQDICAILDEPGTETTFSIKQSRNIADEAAEEISLTVKDENSPDVGVVIDRRTFLKDLQSNTESSPILASTLSTIEVPETKLHQKKFKPLRKMLTKKKSKHLNTKMRNIPLKLKRYHCNFNLHCARKKRMKFLLRLLNTR
ncbi:uncharacterized protein LOC144745988 [Ciona intestinalis]